jgi:serine/threonine protein kinase
MPADSWGEIEELFFRGLHASETLRQQLLSDVRDPHVAAAVVQLWADSSDAPSDFLRDQRQTESGAANRVGEVVEGRFTLDRLLGAGGMGQVFGAVDTRLDRSVALKFLNPGLTRDPVMRELLQREARSICRLAGHPNICTVHDLHWEGETPFLVMELLAGETLAARLARGPLPVEDAVAIGVSIVSGLVHAHAQSVIHRDLKPGNVMLTPFGPKLFDFGIAKRVEPTLLGDTSILSRPGAFAGSVSYTSPEQAEGLPIDARSDIFSIGCVLYEMVTGVKAFDGATRLSVLSAVLRAEPRPIRDITPSVPSAYARLVSKCLEKPPSQRFQHATDLRDALERLARAGFDPHGDAPERSLAPTRDPDAIGDQIHGSGPIDSEHHVASRGPGLLSRGSTHPVCLMLSVAYGVMVGLALLVEIAYEWSTFGAWALPIAALTGVSSIAVSLTAFAVLRRRVVNQRPRALLVPVGIFVVWSVLLALAMIPQLPARALVRATFQTMTATVGYPKSLLEALGLPVLAIVPLQVVYALEAELRRGRVQNVHRILTWDQHARPIPGTIVVRPQAASIVFATVTIWWIAANARLVENLLSGPYYSLFLELAVARAATGLLMLFTVLAWYVWTLNELRQYAHDQSQPPAASER